MGMSFSSIGINHDAYSLPILAPLKELVLEITPYPARAYATCKGCKGPLIPNGYRIKPSKSANWHIACYENKYNLFEMLKTGKAAVVCNANRMDTEGIAFSMQWAIDLEISANKEKAEKEAEKKEKNVLDSGDAGVVGKKRGRPSIADEDDDEPAKKTQKTDLDENFAENFMDKLWPYDTNGAIARAPEKLQWHVFATIGPAIKASDEAQSANDKVKTPRFPAKLSDVMGTIEKRKKRVLHGNAARMNM